MVLAAAMKAYSTERSLGVRTYRLSPGDIRYLSLKLHKGGLDLSLAAVHNDNGGPYYHVFGTRYFEMVVASDWGPDAVYHVTEPPHLLPYRRASGGGALYQTAARP